MKRRENFQRKPEVTSMRFLYSSMQLETEALIRAQFGALSNVFSLVQNNTCQTQPITYSEEDVPRQGAQRNLE